MEAQINGNENGKISVKENKKEQELAETKNGCEKEIDGKRKKKRKRKYDEIVETHVISERKTEQDEKEQNGESKKKKKKIKRLENAGVL